MAEEDEWKKLSTENKVQHKLWKARQEGYKECIKHFKMWDEKSPEFSKYLGLMKKFVTDSNELIRSQGLEACLLYVENSNVAKKTCAEVVSGIIQKCFSAKPKHKTLGMDVCLMYMERDQNQQTQDELLKGIDNKNPKVVASCLDTLALALSVFGSKVIDVKPLLKQTPKLLDHRDKTVRESTKALYIEVYKWIGDSIKTPLKSINAIVFKELEEEWEKIGTTRSKQSRFMRSQQDLKEKAEAAAVATAEGGSGDAGGADEEPAEEIDPYELLDPVEILSKLPKDFYDNLEAKKWQVRRESLELCLKLSETPKIEPGDFGDLMRALKKVVSKDTNVMLVTIAIKCITGLAIGLRKKFQPYATIFVDAFIEKFKEKKITVVKALQDGIDAVYKTTALTNILETIIEGLLNKNPSIREQTGLFLARIITATKKASLSKSTIKALCVPLIANTEHSTPNVRTAAFESLGAILKKVGDKILAPYLADIDKLKMEKISEFAGKIQDKAAASSDSAAVSQTRKTVPTKSKPEEKPKVVKAGKKPAAAKKAVKSNGTKKEPKPVADAPPLEAEMSETAVEDALADFLPEENRKQIANMNWKERLEGLQQCIQKIKIADKKSLPCQAIVSSLGSGKPGWKDTNFNCLNAKFEILKLLSEYGTFSRTTGNLCLQILVEKIADVKCGNASKEALSSISDSCFFSWVCEEVMERGLSQKNPKIQAEALTWISNGIKEFGINKVNIKLLISKIKISVVAINPAVRTAAFNLTGVLSLYIGDKIKMFFDGEKPAVVQQIDSEVEKLKGESAPVPTRGIKKGTGEPSDNEEEAEEETVLDINDLVSRVDISSKVSEDLLSKLSDKNWKIRKQSLEAVTALLNEAKFVESNLGDLPTALKQRLEDSNKVLVTTTLNILSQLSVSLGSHCKAHVKTFISSLYKVLSDSKPQVRQATLNTMNQWLENTNLSIWLEDDALATAISVAKMVNLRIEILNWFTDKLLATPKLTSAAKDGLEGSIKHLCSCCEDRSADVRAKAQAALPAFIYHLGMDKMMRACGKHSSNSNSILALLEAAKERVPARKSNKPAKASVSQKVDIDIPDIKSAKDEESEKPKVKSENTDAAAKPKSKVGNKAKRPTSTFTKKSEPEVVTGDAITYVANGKEQRIKDEMRLKTLKWIFQAPREELITQLKTQCGTCMSNDLVDEMFHKDFQHHLKALVILNGCLNSSWQACLSTFDLQLRWLTLRFYDTNTTVHLKCLEYVRSAFEQLEADNVRLSDYEANAFIPHLIIKIGENKDQIRKGVHGILQLIGKVYPASKMFNHIIAGLVSKNSRQRTECLDELSILINNHGIDVCQPSAPKALKEIATHIGDRDKGVRSAALNVVVAAYNVCGEVIYKYVGKLSDKDMGMLEERIKRSGKYNAEEPKPVAEKPQHKPPASGDSNNQPKSTKPLPKSSVVNTSHLHSTGNARPDIRMPELFDTECDDLLNVPLQLPPDLLKKIEGHLNSVSKENIESTLKDVIARLANPDFRCSLTALHQLNAIFDNKEKRELLKPNIDQILMVTSVCIRNALNSHFDSNEALSKDSELHTFYKSLLSMNVELFNQKEFAVLAGSIALEDALQAFLMYITDKRWKQPEYEYVGNAYIGGLNRVIMNICTNCETNSLTSALLRLLVRCSDSTPSNFCELLIKSTWRVVANRFSSASGLPESPLPMLKEINEFLKLQSSHKYKILSTGNISKTVKTILSRLCSLYGPKIVEEIEKIEENKTEIAKLVDREMKKCGHNVSVNVSSMSGVKENVNDSSKLSLEAQLSSIFKKIGNREHTKMGLEELYIFKKQHPYYDIEPEISGVTPLFRNYIYRGLSNIEKEKIKNGDINFNQKNATKVDPHTTQEALARFELLRAKCGLPSTSEITKPTVLTSNTNTLNQVRDDIDCIKMPTNPSSSAPKPSLARPSTAPSQQTVGKPLSVEELKRKLERIKSKSAIKK